MFLRMISRCTRSADLVAASRKNFCAAVRAAGCSPAGIGLEVKVLISATVRKAFTEFVFSASLRLRGEHSSYFAGQYARQMNGFSAIFPVSHNSLHMHQ